MQQLGDRREQQRLVGEDPGALRAEVLADQPVLVAAIRERLSSPHDASFEFGLDLLVEGLRAKFARH